MVSVQVRLFSPAAGRAGLCTQMSLACVGCTHRVLATLGLPRSRVCAFPVYTAQAPGCSIGSWPCVACGSSFRVLHKSTDSVGPAFCAFPGPSSSGSQELDGRPLPGAMCFVLSAVPASVSLRASRVHAPCVCSGQLASSRDPSSRSRPSRISGSLWEPENRLGACLQFGRECRLWGRVCPFPLPPASCLRQGWAGPPPASSSLGSISPFVLQTASSVFGPVNFLSLLLSHSLSCCLTLAPSDCPQGVGAPSVP